MKRVRGADVSAVQGVINDATWAAMKAAGIDFVYIRTAIGNEAGADIRFKEYAAAAAAHGIAAGPYFFPYPLAKLDPREQCKRHFALAGGFGLEVGQLPPACDGEWPPRETRLPDGSIENTWAKWNCSAAQIRDWLAAYLDEALAQSGVKIPFYSFRYWLQCIESQKMPELAEHPLWLAQYFTLGVVPTDDQLAAVVPPAPWTSIAMIQHDGNGGLRLPNGTDADFSVIPGGVDVLNQLTQLDRSLAPPPPTLDPAVLAEEGSGIMMDDAIAAYRSTRITA